MANLPISALPAVTTVNAADELAVATDGASKKVTLAQVSTFVKMDSPGALPAGHCRLQVDSPTQVSLRRYQGAYLPVKVGTTWEAKLIPAGGVILANTGLVAATRYYLYAFDNAGALTLEASATGYATDVDSGVAIKTGDPTRTLVGMIYGGPGSPATFLDSLKQRFALTWFNRATKPLASTFSAARTLSTTTFTEIHAEIRAEFLTWADDGVHAHGTGSVNNTTAGHAVQTALTMDTAGTILSVSSFTQAATTSGTRGPHAVAWVGALAEGYHYLTLFGAVSGGVGDWSNVDIPGVGATATRLFAAIRG